MFKNLQEVNHLNIRHIYLLIQTHCTELISNAAIASLAPRSLNSKKRGSKYFTSKMQERPKSNQQQLPVLDGSADRAALLWL